MPIDQNKGLSLWPIPMFHDVHSCYFWKQLLLGARELRISVDWPPTGDSRTFQQLHIGLFEHVGTSKWWLCGKKWWFNMKLCDTLGSNKFIWANYYHFQKKKIEICTSICGWTRLQKPSFTLTMARGRSLQQMLVLSHMIPLSPINIYRSG